MVWLTLCFILIKIFSVLLFMCFVLFIGDILIGEESLHREVMA